MYKNSFHTPSIIHHCIGKRYSDASTDIARGNAVEVEMVSTKNLGLCNSYELKSWKRWREESFFKRKVESFLTWFNLFCNKSFWKGLQLGKLFTLKLFHSTQGALPFDSLSFFLRPKKLLYLRLLELFFFGLTSPFGSTSFLFGFLKRQSFLSTINESQT